MGIAKEPLVEFEPTTYALRKDGTGSTNSCRQKSSETTLVMIGPVVVPETFETRCKSSRSCDNEILRMDKDLARLATLWPHLPDPTKRAILAMIDAAFRLMTASVRHLVGAAKSIIALECVDCIRCPFLWNRF